MNAASAFGDGRAEIVVFQDRTAYISVSSDREGIRTPRALTRAEQMMLDSTSGTATMVDGEIAVPILSPDRRTVASLSIFSSSEELDLAGFERLANAISAGIVDALDSPNGDFLTEVLLGQRDATIVLDTEFRIKWATANISSMLGLSVEEARFQSVLDFLHPDDVDACFDAMIRLREGQEVYRVTVRVLSSTGEYVSVEVTGNDLTGVPAVNGVVLSLRNGEREAEFLNVMERSRLISSTLVNSLRDGVIAVDPGGTISTINDQARKMFGIHWLLAPAQIQSSSFELATLDGEPFNPLKSLGSRVTADETNDTAEPVICRTEGSDPVYLSVSEHAVEDGGHVGLGRLVVFSDITAEYLAVEALREEALHDHLTGLGNRRKLKAHLQELAKSQPPINVAALCIDLDGFKTANDTNGHRIGDQLIQIAAERLSSQLGPGEFLIRQGGDEFLVLIAGNEDMDEAVEAAERFREVLDTPYSLAGQRLDITGSIGVSMQRSSELDGDVLLSHADLALYAAKDNGRNRVARFDKALKASVLDQELRRQLLRTALEDERLVMYFQPLVDAQSGNPLGYEALARIRDQNGTLLAPRSFLDAMVSTSLMWDLDRAAYRQSLRALPKLRAAHGDQSIYVASNFSSVSIRQPDFVETVLSMAGDSGIGAEELVIEVTESSAFEVGEQGSQALHRLAAAGVQILLDDFGTGYSSLAHLRDLPITGLKVDRSFISRLDRGEVNLSIVEAMLSLANGLGLATVAEGVESKAQLEHVRDLGFDVVQGWIYSKALSLQECIDLQRETNQKAA